MNEWEHREMTKGALNWLHRIGALQWAAARGLNIVQVLGHGTSGVALLLDNGLVLKITTHEDEVSCLDYLTSNSIQLPVLPKVYEYGRFGRFEKFFFIIREEIPDLPKSLMQALPPSPSFLRDKGYLRANTLEVVDFYDQIDRAIADFEATGLYFHDIDWIFNWGRRWNGIYVFRDVVCWMRDPAAESWLKE